MMTAMGTDADEAKRGYDLRRRLEQMDQTRLSILRAARDQLESQGYRQMTMASLATASGITRQTIHNLFGSKRGVLEALFDTLALEGGMERMRDVMQQAQPNAMLLAFVHVFCEFWGTHQLLFRRIHGIGAVDPDFGEIIEARNQRRQGIATRIVRHSKVGTKQAEAAAALTALTSFEFFDALLRSGRSSSQAEAIIIELGTAVLGSSTCES